MCFAGLDWFHAVFYNRVCTFGVGRKENQKDTD